MRSLFDLTAPLPRGTTVLEASAGTGKTFAIAALAARYIAEGRADVDDLLLITFSRAATAELAVARPRAPARHGRRAGRPRPTASGRTKWWPPAWPTRRRRGRARVPLGSTRSPASTARRS